MKDPKIFDNKILFILYGTLNLILILVLLVLLIFLFNDVFIISRIGFVVFVGIHIFLLIFVKIHYLSLYFYEDEQKIEFHYNRQFGLKWQQKTRTVLLPFHQFDGYKIERDNLGIMVMTFYKKEQKERFELGPFHIGFISRKEKKDLISQFGESL